MIDVLDDSLLIHLDNGMDIKAGDLWRERRQLMRQIQDLEMEGFHLRNDVHLLTAENARLRPVVEAMADRNNWDVTQFRTDKRVTNIWVWFYNQNPDQDHADPTQFAQRALGVDTDVPRVSVR